MLSHSDEQKIQSLTIKPQMSRDQWVLVSCDSIVF